MCVLCSVLQTLVLTIEVQDEVMSAKFDTFVAWMYIEVYTTFGVMVMNAGFLLVRSIFKQKLTLGMAGIF